MNRQGPSGQPMRGMAGFPNQQSQLGRTTTRGGAGGVAAGWGFGMQNGSGQGLNPSQGRGLGAQSTFAQSLGGQSSASLDLSEFPSLSGSTQPQFPSSGQAVWSNQRSGQQGLGQRGQLGVNQPRTAHSAQEQAQQNIDDAFFPSGAGNAGLDDFRHAGAGLGQLSLTQQQQSSGNADEFPPLGRRGPGDIGQDRRMNIMQNAASGNYGAGSNFPGDQSASRGAGDAGRPGQDRGARGQHNGNSENPLYDLQQSNAASVVVAAAAAAAEGQNGTEHNRTKTPSQMPDRDRYGLSGLLEQIRNGDSDNSNLAIGMDLTSLGLDLNSSEPLYPTFAGPFANGPTRPLQPDFVLPACYSVTNIHPIEEKIGSLSDETLFFIFYTMPRDVMQEQAAVELTHRNWRYHKVLNIWITKEQGYADPQPIAQDVERGRYIIFNQHAWQRESREMILRYADLDDHITAAAPGTLP